MRSLGAVEAKIPLKKRGRKETNSKGTAASTANGFSPEMPDNSVSLEVVRKAQLRRNDVVKILAHPDLPSLVADCFVRVLLELENRGEDYRIGRVISVDHGQSYSGFTHDVNTTTTVYLHLQLQGHLSGINGSHYQLNSISNSPITDAELAEWLEECPVDPDQVATAAAKVRTVQAMPRPAGPSALRQSLDPSPSSALVNGDSAVFPPQQLGATVSNGGHGAPSAALGATAIANQQQTQRAPGSGPNRGDVELELPTVEQLRRQVLEECRCENAVFPRELSHLTASQLRIVERELMDYLERTRECITSSQSNCVVCLERLPTIITLPCKHKVLCRLCATQVNTCPVCRTTAVEMFEPVEI